MTPMEARTNKGAVNLWDLCRTGEAPLEGTRKVIVFGLRCHHGHEFEGWFRSSADFDEQKDKGHLTCPACASHRVEKAIMAPNLSRVHIREDAPRPYGERPDLTDNAETVAQLEAEIAEMRRQLREELRDHVETHFDYVGDEFASEARRRFHEGDDRGVYGETGYEELVALIEDEIPVAPLPLGTGKSRKKLN